MNHSDRPKGASSSNGITSFDLGKGWMALETIILVKCLDPEGQVKYREMTSATLHPVEALGMLETMSDTIRTRLMSGARTIGDD